MSVKYFKAEFRKVMLFGKDKDTQFTSSLLSKLSTFIKSDSYRQLTQTERDDLDLMAFRLQKIV